MAPDRLPCPTTGEGIAPAGASGNGNAAFHLARPGRYAKTMNDPSPAMGFSAITLSAIFVAALAAGALLFKAGKP